MQLPFRLQTFAPLDDASALSAWLSEQARLHPDQCLYALLDGGQIEGLAPRLQRLAPQSHGSLFRALAKTDLEPAGAWLLEVGHQPSDPRLSFACEEVLACPAVLWFQSPLGLTELLKLLAPRMDAKLARGPEVYLRYYDPRIFTNLVGVLQPEQAPFLSMASRWYWLDHAGQRCVLEVPLDLPAARALATPVAIDQAQEKALIDGSLPYEVMNILEQDVPGILAPVPARARYGLLRQGVDKALAQGQHRLSELATACLQVIAETDGGANAH